MTDCQNLCGIHTYERFSHAAEAENIRLFHVFKLVYPEKIENEEMQDTRLEDALTQAARRGVSIQVVLPAPAGGQDSNAPGVALLRKANISVRYDKQYYIHAKLMLIDQTRAYVGSENISTASLDDNRELGLIVADPPTIKTLATTFSSDYAVSQEYTTKSG